ncbi:methyltransferase regulatory domain-containing protein [Achromobacter deleyi]|uniref:O-linked N-acetylglucosamine transferase family protein n=1 Tax=Achromobacter deleyi TaxID=1353891 RepID=UPI001490FA6E|nr:methyltransferase regulatory domain-containing protein [Achromobacter deleyi]QVQ28768.1 methyltransferase regulatory domain-containing protein [Achromobacter deleyi]UIP18884.1 methyltransferase regulatory domain-containing protein [Achromobacter deleyi]
MSNPALTQHQAAASAGRLAPCHSPLRLRAVAHLYGIQTAPLQNARVLVLSCGAAEGLIPYALANSDAIVVGLDSRPELIELGQRRIDALAITNVTLRVSDYASLASGAEPFDYIIAPAIYDYLPPDQAQGLLEQCRQLLSPLGLLYVDHHVYPGAKGLEIVRDAILLHSHAAQSEDEVKTSARAALTLFKEGLASANPMGSTLEAIAHQFTRSLESNDSPSLLACSPSYFIEFASKAAQAGFAYAGDAVPLSEVALEFGPNVSLSHSLLCMGQPPSMRQQYLDFATGRGFRQSLLISQNRAQEVLPAPDLSRLAELRWASGLIRLVANGQEQGASYVTHTGRGLKTTDPVMVDLLTVMSRAWPSTLSYTSILSALIVQTNKDETALRKSLDKCLKVLLEADLAHFCLDEGPYDNTDTPFRPLRSIALAETSPPLFNLWHEHLHLEFNSGQRALLRELSAGKSLQQTLALEAAKFAEFGQNASDLVEVLSLLKRYALQEGSARAWCSLLEAGLIESEGRGHYVGLYVDALARLSLNDSLDVPPSVPPAPAILTQAKRLNLAMVHQSYSEAEPLARTLTTRAPRFFDGWEALAVTLCNTRRPAEALLAALRMLDLAPLNAQSYIILAACLTQLDRTSEAISAGRRAVELSPENAHTHSVLADTLNTERRYQEAKAACLRALTIDPNQQKALANLSKILIDSGDAEGAVIAARDAVARAPKSLTANNNLLFALNYAPSVTAQEVFQAYQTYDQTYCQALRRAWRPHKNARQTSRKIKVGIASPDFRKHSGNCFIEPLLAQLDRARFELTAYAELTSEDAMTQRFKGLFENWVPTARLTDSELSDRIRTDEIDILIDVAGHTAGNRLAVFARKPAPVSLTWLGFGYTTGLSAIDYIMTDAAMAPPGSEDLFAERPWRLSETNFIYRPGKDMGEPGPLPAIAKGHVTLGSLTRAIRMNDRTIGVWSEILRRLPRARLVVDSTSYRDVPMQEGLIARFESQGIDRSRLSIGCHSPPWDVLRSMDIGLDCFPHNSGVTLVESLYMGVPYVTLADRPSVGRIGSSVLHGIGHPEWISQTELEYVEKVVALASDLPALAKIRAGLRDEMHASPLMDEPAFARKFEGALTEMFKNWCDTQA